MSNTHSIIRLFVVLLPLLATGCASWFIPDYGHIASDYQSFSPVPSNILIPPNAPSISQGFKPERNASRGQTGDTKAHNGIDIIAETGTAVLATATGTVINSYFEPFYGNRIILDHGKDSNGNHIKSVYFHLQKRLVDVGESVDRGQKIGTLGRSGILSGGMAHLHFEIRTASSLEQPLSEPLYPHRFWAEGYGTITCYEKGKAYPEQTFKTTYPVPCRGVDWE